MAMQRASKFCSYCDKMVLAERSNGSDAVHIILILVTGGLWLLVMGAYALLRLCLSVTRFSGWRCTVCGQRL